MASVNKRGPKPIPKEDLIKDILNVAEQLQQDYLGIEEYHKYGLYSISVTLRNFDTWNKAITIAGLKPYKPLTEKELLDDLIRVAAELKPSKLNILSYESKGKYSRYTYIYRFGNWSVAMKKAGLAPANKPKQNSIKKPTKRKINPTSPTK